MKNLNQKLQTGFLDLFDQKIEELEKLSNQLYEIVAILPHFSDGERKEYYQRLEDSIADLTSVSEDVIYNLRSISRLADER